MATLLNHAILLFATFLFLIICGNVQALPRPDLDPQNRPGCRAETPQGGLGGFCALAAECTAMSPRGYEAQINQETCGSTLTDEEVVCCYSPNVSLEARSPGIIGIVNAITKGAKKIPKLWDDGKAAWKKFWKPNGKHARPKGKHGAPKNPFGTKWIARAKGWPKEAVNFLKDHLEVHYYAWKSILTKYKTPEMLEEKLRETDLDEINDAKKKILTLVAGGAGAASTAQDWVDGAKLIADLFAPAT